MCLIRRAAIVSGYGWVKTVQPMSADQLAVRLAVLSWTKRRTQGFKTVLHKPMGDFMIGSHLVYAAIINISNMCCLTKMYLCTSKLKYFEQRWVKCHIQNIFCSSALTINGNHLLTCTAKAFYLISPRFQDQTAGLQQYTQDVDLYCRFIQMNVQ